MGNREQANNLLAKGEEAALDKSQPTNQDHAYQLLSSACYTDPSYGHAFYVNGCTASDLIRPHASIALFRRALESDLDEDERPKALTNLAWELMKIGGQREALTYLHQAIDLNPKLALPYMHAGMINQIFGNTKLAVEYAYKCFELADPNDGQGYPIAEFQLAFALLFDGQYAAGLKHFRVAFSGAAAEFSAVSVSEVERRTWTNTFPRRRPRLG